MTEPQAGADPARVHLPARAGRRRLGDRRREVVRLARGLRELPARRRGHRPGRADPPGRVDPRSSIATPPGLEIVRNVAVGLREEIGRGVHGYLRFTDCRVPKANILGRPGQGFEVAQSRLGGGRIHHAMRTVGQLKRALDMMCERALSRRTKGELLASKQLTQEKIADSYIQITQFRLHVLYAAWLIDKHQAYTREVRREIAAVKAAMPGGAARRRLSRAAPARLARHVERDAADGACGSYVPEMGIVDGPTEVHKIAVAKEVLRDRRASAACSRATTCRSASATRGRVRPRAGARRRESLAGRALGEEAAVTTDARLEELLARIDQLESRHAMRDLVTDYCRGFDRRRLRPLSRDLVGGLRVEHRPAVRRVRGPRRHRQGGEGRALARMARDAPPDQQPAGRLRRTEISAHGECDVDCMGATRDDQACR